ncbi:MAG: hypothetical protein Q8P67_26465 [archaeon]|nr:hypothetical protein [archaeon]
MNLAGCCFWFGEKAKRREKNATPSDVQPKKARQNLSTRPFLVGLAFSNGFPFAGSVFVLRRSFSSKCTNGQSLFCASNRFSKTEEEDERVGETTAISQERIIFGVDPEDGGVA